MSQIRASEPSSISRPATAPAAQKKSSPKATKVLEDRRPPQRVEVTEVPAAKDSRFMDALVCLAAIGMEAIRQQAATRRSEPAAETVGGMGASKPLTTAAEDVAGETRPE